MKGSIYKKIRKQMLFGSFVAAAVVCLAAVIIISILRGSIIGASEELGTSAAVDSKTALEIQMEESLFQLAGIKSYLIDEKLSAAANLVSITAHNAQYIVSEPEAYYRVPSYFLMRRTQGVLSRSLGWRRMPTTLI